MHRLVVWRSKLVTLMLTMETIYNNFPAIRKNLLKWFYANKRVLPWRSDRNWYAVWISEIMLQQTQVSQVIPYFERFMAQFPTVQILAVASTQDVLKAWEGLGYYSRARNLHRTAQIIVKDFAGEMPSEKSLLLKLPGIGLYTCHALLSLAFNQPFSVVDGNVKRVIARLFEITDDLRNPDTTKLIQSICDKLLAKKKAGDFNEALMEIGALICTPATPSCLKCPLQTHCKAYTNDLTSNLPVVSAKKPVPLKQQYALINIINERLVMARRPNSGLLGGMWEFPTIDCDKLNNKVTDITDNSVGLEPVNHTYSHFRLKLTPLLLNQSIEGLTDHYLEFRTLLFDELDTIPIHKVIHKLLEKNKVKIQKAIADQKS